VTRGNWQFRVGTAPFSARCSATIAAVNTRARWTVGILVALVIGLAVGLIIVIGDDDNKNASTTVPIESISTPTTSPTTTSQTTTQSTTTNQSGGTPAPGGTTKTTPGGTGGL
jgi:hypothetical protein